MRCPEPTGPEPTGPEPMAQTVPLYCDVVLSMLITRITRSARSGGGC